LLRLLQILGRRDKEKGVSAKIFIPPILVRHLS